MQKIIEKHKQVKMLVTQINQISTEETSNKIIFFKDITIEVSYSSPGGCFSELVNWFYALFIEVCGPNIKFFEDRMRILGMTAGNDVAQIPKIVHVIRTVNSHNLDYSKLEDKNKKKFLEDWYTQVINKIKPETDQDYLTCAEIVLDKIIDYLKSLCESVIKTVNDDFFADILLPEWQRRNDRDYGVYDFEVVFMEQLQLFEIDTFLDVNKIAKREISKWKDELKCMKDGFDFKLAAANIIQKYITREKYSPVDAKDLIDKGAPKGIRLKELCNIIADEFYREPKPKEELLVWAKEQGLI